MSARTRALITASGLAVGVAAAVIAPGAAHGNGRPPQSVKLDFRPGSSTDMLLGVTFGLLVSNDDAATWRWICETAVGFEGTFDPDYEYSSSGAIFATTFDGLRYTRDGCVWSGVPEPLGTWLVTSVAIGPDGAIYAGAADPVLGSGMFKSTDDGASFQPTGPLNQAFDWFESIEVAPSDPQRIYITGYKLDGPNPRQKLLFRSTDGGASWESLPTAGFGGTNFSGLLIRAIDPDDPDIVYVVLTFSANVLQETLFRTANASAAAPEWTQVLQVPGNITAVAARENGEVWATTPGTGIHRSTDRGMTFAAVVGLDYEGHCMVERPGDASLWLCANNLPPNEMALGRSPSGNPGTWETKLRFAQIVGPVRCPAGNDQHDECEARAWCSTKDQLGITSEEIDCAASVDASVDSPGGNGNGDPKPCCGAGGGPPGVEVGAGALALVLLLRRRRHRAHRGSAC